MIQVKERQRYAFIDRGGRATGVWQVVDVHSSPDGRDRVTLFDLDDPSDTIVVNATALADAKRFRLIADAPEQAA